MALLDEIAAVGEERTGVDAYVGPWRRRAPSEKEERRHPTDKSEEPSPGKGERDCHDGVETLRPAVGHNATEDTRTVVLPLSSRATGVPWL
jgi:hypothetical protein